MGRRMKNQGAIQTLARREAYKVLRAAQENKYRDTLIPVQNIDNLGQIIRLTTVVQGDSVAGQCTGIKFKLSKLHLKYTIAAPQQIQDPDEDDECSAYRLILFQWHEDDNDPDVPGNIDLPNPVEILQLVANPLAPLSAYNHESGSKYTIIYDELIEGCLTTQGRDTNGLITFDSRTNPNYLQTGQIDIDFRKIGKKFKFTPIVTLTDAGVSTGQIDGLYLLVISNGAGVNVSANIQAYCRVTYTDS